MTDQLPWGNTLTFNYPGSHHEYFTWIIAGSLAIWSGVVPLAFKISVSICAPRSTYIGANDENGHRIPFLLIKLTSIPNFEPSETAV